jgi:hypothetical protein
MTMIRLHRFTAAALAATALVVATSATAAHADEEPPHWPQPNDARALCADPWLGAALGYNVIFGGPGFFPGTSDPDLMIASPDSDQAYGYEGDDVICLFGDDDEGHGGLGDDIVFGMNGDDELTGGPGADALFGDNGDDNLLGGDGPDLLNGGPHSNGDSCTGGLGADTLVACNP